MRYGLLGKTLAHSYSPQLHALMGDPSYRLYEMTEDQAVRFVKSGDYDGINVTIPYKETVLPLLDEVSPRAAAIGSVNTIVRGADGRLYGYNTDYDGFAALLRRAGIDASGKKCLVLGSGGSSRTVRAVLSDAGARQIVTISRSGPDNYQTLARHEDAQLIVNTTPVGMYPSNGQAPLSLEGFPALEAVADIIYNPARTALLLDAEKRGIRAAGGLPMLVYQAKRARELFDGRDIPDAEAERILALLERQMRNITLVGMPGSGKTTVGELIALRLGWEFCDTDLLFERRYGVTAEQMIRTDGESAFREAESTVIAEVCKKSGLVIATGGGSVLREENRNCIRSNSTVVFLRRALCALCCDGRPLSAGGETVLRGMYEQREPLYRAVSDMTVDNDGDPQRTAQIILEALGYENTGH